MTERRLFVLAHDTARKRCAQAVAQAPDGWMVTVEPPRRSGEQNAMLHALIGEIAERCEWAGRKWDAETWKRMLVSAWTRSTGRPVLIVPALDGFGVDMVPRRTSKLSKGECAELLDYVQAWAAEQMGNEVER